MAKEQRFFSASRGLGPRASRRGVLQAGLAIRHAGAGPGVLRWGSPTARTLTCPKSAWRTLPVVPAMDQPLA